MAGEDLVEVDPPQPLGSEPHGELAGEAFVPRLVPEAPDIDHILVRIHDPVLTDAGSRVQVELDPAVPVRGDHPARRNRRPGRWSFTGITFDQVATCSYVVFMRSIGIRALNSRLSEYVRLAAGGETVLVTDRGRVVAELGPPRETRSPILADAMLAAAVRKGWLTPALSPGSEPPRGGPPEAPLHELLGELEGDRSDR